MEQLGVAPNPRRIFLVYSDLKLHADEKRFGMTVAVGQKVYEIGGFPCSGIGLKWISEELDQALQGPVAALILDNAGKTDIRSVLANVVETNWEREKLDVILNGPTRVESWRVGEAIAEIYLIDHRACQFPWPHGRDARKQGSSLPGADLVGLSRDDQGACLVFGEVKTSSDKQYPPSLMYGDGGLKQQLEDLLHSSAIRDTLFTYLAHRATNAEWQPLFQSAAQRYLKNKEDIHIYGILIRDVSPNVMDLQARVLSLARVCNNRTRVELLALYLPSGRITELGRTVGSVQQKDRGDT